MLLNDSITFHRACKSLSGLAGTLERIAAAEDNFEAAAVWRDRASLLYAIWLCGESEDELVLEEFHIDLAIDTLVNSILRVPGLVECHLVNRKTGEIAFLIGEDERLDFAVDRELLDELKELKVLRK
jgi:hypothetical protein